MKRALFLLVSALLAGTAYTSNLSKEIIAKVTNSDEVSISEQKQSLILEQPVRGDINAQWHGSHRSHRSHGSHGSHRSHYSSRY